MQFGSLCIFLLYFPLKVNKFAWEGGGREGKKLCINNLIWIWSAIPAAAFVESVVDVASLN